MPSFFFFMYLGSCTVCDNMQNSWITFFTINRCSRSVNCWYCLIAIFIFNCLLKIFQNTDLFEWLQVLVPKFYLNFICCIIPRSFLIIQIISLYECQNSKYNSMHICYEWQPHNTQTHLMVLLDERLSVLACVHMQKQTISYV